MSEHMIAQSPDVILEVNDVQIHSSKPQVCFTVVNSSVVSNK